MSIRAINKNDNRRSYLAAGTYGVVGGYLIKNAMPLSDYEKHAYFTPEVIAKLQKIAKKARKEEFEAIIKSAEENKDSISADVLNVFKANKNNIIGDDMGEFAQNISDCDSHVQDGVAKLAKRVYSSGKDAKATESKTIKALAKSSRPTLYFILATTAVLLSVAVLKNALFKDTSYNCSSEHCDYCA